MVAISFQEWARFTGKFVEGRDKPDFKMFKTRLRCAFNKAPDIEELTDLRKYKGISPYRVYRLLPYGNLYFLTTVTFFSLLPEKQSRVCTRVNNPDYCISKVSLVHTDSVLHWTIFILQKDELSLNFLPRT